MIDKINAANAAVPEDWHLRIKEHPSADHSFSGRIADASGGRVVLDNETNTTERVATSRAVITINSSVLGRLRKPAFHQAGYRAGPCHSMTWRASFRRPGPGMHSTVSSPGRIR
ncbi:hypothetical protein [Roseovarius sp. SYSU LYC5161]|uniref:hypothetical protein n=1 Tax=Roseovarius halophilus (ex Wu et al. 2025) TaxID=3376060 RepID=UPI00399C1190